MDAPWWWEEPSRREDASVVERRMASARAQGPEGVRAAL